MIKKYKLYSIALVSSAMILMLVSITGAAPFAYIANSGNNNVSVIDTATNTVTATVNVGNYPSGAAVTPDETKVDVTNYNSNDVSVINTTNHSAYASVNVGTHPFGVAVTPDRTKVYVTDYGNNNVSVINTATNDVEAVVPVGNGPIALGKFIGKQAPTITWSNPANITYGTALNSTQLDATASVPGTFI